MYQNSIILLFYYVHTLILRPKATTRKRVKRSPGNLNFFSLSLLFLLLFCRSSLFRVCVHIFMPASYPEERSPSFSTCWLVYSLSLSLPFRSRGELNFKAEFLFSTNHSVWVKQSYKLSWAHTTYVQVRTSRVTHLFDAYTLEGESSWFYLYTSTIRVRVWVEKKTVFNVVVVHVLTLFVCLLAFLDVLWQKIRM